MGIVLLLSSLGASACSCRPSSLESFAWQQQWGPCDAGPCTVRLAVDSRRAITLEEGTTRAATITVQNFDSLEDLLTGPPVVDALRDPSPCAPPVADAWESVDVVYGGGETLHKEIVFCGQAPYEAIRERVLRLQTSYFPACPCLGLPGYACCSSVCVDLRTDPNDCGDCAIICAAGTTCVSGGCR